MAKIILSICLGGLAFAIINYIAPLYSQSADKKECAPYEPKPRGVSGILYCECDDKINQEPGKCR